MVPQLVIEGQVIKFTASADGEDWMSTLVLEEAEVEIEFALEAEEIGNANWVKIESTLQLIINKQQDLLVKARKNLLYLMKESGLFSSMMMEAAKPCLGSIYLLYPTAAQQAFQLVFELDSDHWIDPYGAWKVSFVGEHVVGIERVQL